MHFSKTRAGYHIATSCSTEMWGGVGGGSRLERRGRGGGREREKEGERERERGRERWKGRRDRQTEREGGVIGLGEE